MKLIKQTSPNCLLFSVAMLLDIPPEILFKTIGHDGLEIWWPELPPPRCYRGVHIEEMIDCCVACGRGLMPVTPNPISSPYPDGHDSKEVMTVARRKIRKETYLTIYDALLITTNHAVAWNHIAQRVYDPNGSIRFLNDYAIEQIWLLI